jgi:hypothetical protein
MTANTPQYRRREAYRPGRGLALIVAPDGREALWARNLRVADAAPCARCGAVVARHDRPAAAFGRGADGPRLCPPCAESTSVP